VAAGGLFRMLFKMADIALELPLLHLEDATEALVLPSLSSLSVPFLLSPSLLSDACISLLLLEKSVICLLLPRCIA